MCASMNPMNTNWVYRLTQEEEGICAEVGYQRQKPFLGDQSRNKNYAEGDIWEMWQHAVCAASELAFARMMGNFEFVPHVNKFKSELDFPEWGEVRHSNKQGLRFTKYDDPELKYVLMGGGITMARERRDPQDGYKTPPYVALGWMYGKDCMEDEWLSPYKNTTWYVPKNKLRKMDDTEYL
jgi:hypothetical protein